MGGLSSAAIGSSEPRVHRGSPWLQAGWRRPPEVKQRFKTTAAAWSCDPSEGFRMNGANILVQVAPRCSCLWECSSSLPVLLFPFSDSSHVRVVRPNEPHR